MLTMGGSGGRASRGRVRKAERLSFRAMGERQENVRNESRLFLNGEDSLANIVGKVRQSGYGITADGGIAHCQLLLAPKLPTITLAGLKRIGCEVLGAAGRQRHGRNKHQKFRFL